MEDNDEDGKDVIHNLREIIEDHFLKYVLWK